MARNSMTLEEAKKIVGDVLAKHGNEIDLRGLLASIPEGQRAVVARMFTELRKSGAVNTELTVNNESGVVAHTVRKGSN